MRETEGRTLTGGQEWLRGRLAGTVLQAVRSHIGYTQEQLAESTGRTLTTVQAWESGRRPVTNMSYAELRRLRRTLQLAGAPERLLRCWDDSLTAETIYEDIGAPSNQQHPFALTVPDRRLTELMLWPMTGSPPRALAEVRAQLAVPAGTRADLAESLRAVVEAADDATPVDAMIRRQTRHLLAEYEPARGWVMELAKREQRKVHDMSMWTPDWPAARSAAIGAAAAGEPQLLERFVAEGLSTEAGMDANLNYWAYWVGENDLSWTTDSDMAGTEFRWAGHLLLESLLDGLDANVAYRELCAHSLWGLLRRKRELCRDPLVRQRLLSTIEVATADERTVSDNARRRLEQVAYLVAD